jgi:hypothetical protein
METIDPIEVTEEEYDVALAASEELLVELGASLDEPVKNEYLERALLVLGRKARTMFLGFAHLIKSDVPSAAFVLLRPAVEVNLVVRFLVARPEVHLELWEGEADLELLKWVREIENDPDLAELTRWPGVPDGFKETLEEGIAASRALGLQEGVKGVSADPRRNVLPNLHDLAHSHGDLTTRHAYWAAFRPLSTVTHASSRGFTHGEFIAVDGDRITFRELSDAPSSIRAHRALCAATYASTLTVVSEPLGLDVLEPAGRARDYLVSMTLRGRDSSSSRNSYARTS